MGVSEREAGCDASAGKLTFASARARPGVPGAPTGCPGWRRLARAVSLGPGSRRRHGFG